MSRNLTARLLALLSCLLLFAACEDPASTATSDTSDTSTTGPDGDEDTSETNTTLADTTDDATTTDGTSGTDAVQDDADVVTPPPDYAHFFAETITDTERAALDARILDATIPDVHPRLYGTNDVWLAHTYDVFTGLDSECVWEGNRNGRGNVKNTAKMWSYYTLGDEGCGRDVPTTLAEHRDAGPYLDGTGNTGSLTSRDQRRLRVLHLLRFLLDCHERGLSSCPFASDETDALVTAFIADEVQRLRAITPNSCGFIPEWHRTSQQFFDIGTYNGFKFWPLFLDLFWDHPALSDADQTFISDALEREIDSYLCSYEGINSSYCGDAFDAPCNRSSWPEVDTTRPEGYQQCHWSLCNGNNWTPLVNAAALPWALVFAHEKPAKARLVLEAVLDTNWLHRQHVLSDGTYTEGPTYFGLSIGPSLEMNQLLRGTFGEPLHSYRWGVLEQTALWQLDSMAPDGKYIDFGDAWDRTGFASMHVLDMLFFREVTGMEPYGSTDADPCVVARFFQNSYHDHQFYDTWVVEPHLARDWASIAATCTTPPESFSRLYAEQRLGVHSTRTPGATQLATSGNLYTQADTTYLAINATPNSWPHRELDFGALIWTAYGNRLLADFGYGQIIHKQGYLFFYNDLNFLDHFATGANTLVIPEAFDGLSYAGQEKGTEGTMRQLDVDGITFTELNGDALSTTHLAAWRRWTAALPDGSFLLIDAIRASDSAPTTAQEFFWIRDDTKTDCAFPPSQDVEVTVVDANTLELRPRCNELEREGTAEAVGRIVAASDKSAAFSASLLPELEADSTYAANFVERGNVIRLPTRTNSEVRRELIRFAPDTAVDTDIRAFLLQSGTTDSPTSGTLSRVDCDGGDATDVCFSVNADGTPFTLRITSSFELIQAR